MFRAGLELFDINISALTVFIKILMIIRDVLDQRLAMVQQKEQYILVKKEIKISTKEKEQIKEVYILVLVYYSESL